MGAVLNRLDLRGRADLRSLLPRPGAGRDDPVESVREIIADVRERGDEALRELTARFDGVQLDDLRVAPEEISAARGAVDSSVLASLETAHEAIRRFHESQRRGPHDHELNGVRVRSVPTPVGRAGLYVPGGRAAYPSTVLMTATPAKVAGVAGIALCVPPMPNRSDPSGSDRGRSPSEGGVATVTLAAAAVAGVEEVYAVGGAQAIAAMAYGTESIAPVDVIAGPGNAYVAVAKREVAGVVGVPSAFAGPSEIVVLADDSTPPELAAADLLVQAEHGPSGLAWLVTWSEDLADAVDREVRNQLADAPRRADIEATLESGGWIALVDGPGPAMEVANFIAPEHLQLMCIDPESLVPEVRNAGAVFCGPWAPASIGDYVAGPSHVLPTYGSARYSGALTVDDFVKQVHVVSLERSGFEQVAPVVEALALAEGLDAHARSVEIRREVLG